MDLSFSDLNYNSVETLPGYEARAAFTVNSSSVFREDVDIVPTVVDDTLSYIPWGGDNQMPFDLLALVEKDETLATCQCFNAEVCYGSGLQYCVAEASAAVKSAVEDFTLDNDLAEDWVRTTFTSESTFNTICGYTDSNPVKYSDFFQPTANADTGGNLLGSSAPSVEDAMNTQIRALTKGDVTKEAEVLALDTHRALTELNAQAREYRELNTSPP